ncbi:unnamed protein product, partial [Heterosigma akashiwo]
ILYSVCQVISIVLFAVFVDYQTYTDAQAEINVRTYYQFYTDVAYMIWVGFGFLMTFLRKYMYSSMSYTLLLSSLAMQYVIIWEGLFHHDHIDLDLTNVIGGLFGAGAVMISFGAVLGKASPTQLCIMTMLEAVFFALEGYICFTKLEMTDTGGSLAVHAFGAYFGLACSLMMSNNKDKTEDDHPENAGSYVSDMFAMIGTIFLWILWPSFNGALAGPGAQLRVLLNTLLALNASSVCGFVFSRLFTENTRGNRFQMVHIQNATLAGGVMMGSSCDLINSPAAALSVGVVASLVCTLGYEYATPKLNRAIGLNDTMGVNNLHGMPGLLAAVISAFVLLGLSEDGAVCGGDCEAAFHGRSQRGQAGYQMLALLVTLGLALGGGAFTGAVIKLTTRLGLEDHGPKESHFTDDRYW